MHSHARSHTHARTLTRTHAHSHALAYARTHTHARTLTRTLTRTHTRARTLSPKKISGCFWRLFCDSRAQGHCFFSNQNIIHGQWWISYITCIGNLARDRGLEKREERREKREERREKREERREKRRETKIDSASDPSIKTSRHRWRFGNRKVIRFAEKVWKGQHRCC